jgi:hypothetical protein
MPLLLHSSRKLEPKIKCYLYRIGINTSKKITKRIVRAVVGFLAIF